MIDAHIHLNQYNVDTLNQDIEKWKECGIKQVIAVSNDLASSYETLELQLTYPDFVKACVGFHPEFDLPHQKDFQEWKRLIRDERKRIAAIGEIGLPHYQLDSLPGSLDQYIDMLKQYLDEAAINQFPVALHAVHDKAEIVYTLLQQYDITHAHFHWLKATEHVVNQIVAGGYFISVTPEICYRNRDKHLASNVPLTQLLIETDGPWQFDGNFKNQRTSPLLLSNTIRELAKIKKTTEYDTRVQTVLNTKQCYKLSENME